MADVTTNKKLDVDPVQGSGMPPRWRAIAIGVLVALLAFGAWSVFKAVSKGKVVASWERVAEVTSLRDDSFDRTWLEVPSESMDAIMRDQHLAKLEALLEQEGESSKVAPHLHAVIANVVLEQILGAPASMPSERLMGLYDKADAHLKILEESYPDAAINSQRLAASIDSERPNIIDRVTVARLLRDRLAKNREWQAKYGLKPVEPEPDVVVLLRTTAGDLRMRLYSQEDAAPALSKAFLERVCAGVYDGTSLFAKRDELTQSYVRGGDERTKAPATAPAPGDEVDTTDWGAPSPGEPTLPERSRGRILHVKGVVSAWHDPISDVADDPTQFLICVQDSSSLDFDFTPFGKIEEASLPVLERIHARKTRGEEKPELRLDPASSKTIDQFAKPVTIVKALVYDKGVLRACGDASKVDESEKKLDTVKVDAHLVPEAPAPPTPPAGMDAGMDGAGMDEPGMDAGMTEGMDGDTEGAMDAGTAPPAMNDDPK